MRIIEQNMAADEECAFPILMGNWDKLKLRRFYRPYCSDTDMTNRADKDPYGWNRVWVAEIQCEARHLRDQIMEEIKSQTDIKLRCLYKRAVPSGRLKPEFNQIAEIVARESQRIEQDYHQLIAGLTRLGVKTHTLVAPTTAKLPTSCFEDPEEWLEINVASSHPLAIWLYEKRTIHPQS